ncbi:MAG: hypothetical protein QXM04_02505 [Nanopusillaceae archaeon]
MRSISWIEFLITFFVFIIAFYMLFNNLTFVIFNSKSQAADVNYFQKFLISSYYYIQKGEINMIKSLFINLNTSLSNYEILEFLILPQKNISCFNCLYAFYNLSDESINIVQSSSINIHSKIDLKLIVNKMFFNFTNNSEIRCFNYLDLMDELIIFCSISLYGNSSVKFFPAKNYVYFNLIDSFLDFYDGERYYNSTKGLSRIYARKFFEFYINRGNSVVRNIFIIN